MKFHRRGFLHLGASAAALPAISRIARTQTYPARPITMVVPFPAGGTIDVLARMSGKMVLKGHLLSESPRLGPRSP
jgi:tripartite-type tricarboxylate transporter receptor subunit TctC